MRELLAKRRVLPKDVQRVTFNAITKDTVTQAMQHPRELDQDLIDAYPARRALDYLFAYAAVGQGASCPAPRARAACTGGVAPDRRARPRDRGIPPTGVLVCQRSHEQGGTEFPALPRKFDGQKLGVEPGRGRG